MSNYDHIINTYQITISGLAGLTGGGADDGGSIDHTKAENYSAYPTTKTRSQNKERANMRWEALSKIFFLYSTPFRVYGMIATGADQNTPATAFTFNVSFDRADYVIYPSNPALTDLQAIAYLTADALSMTITNQKREYYDPTTYTTANGATDVFGPRTELLTAGALGGGVQATVLAAITVTQIS